MKNLKFLGVVAMATVLLTSCLDGGKNEADFTAYGVLSYDSKFGKNMFFIADEVPYYVAALANDPNFMGDGECLVANLHVDRDSPEYADATSKGYYVATTPSGYSKLDKYSIIPSLTDTVKPLDKELTLKDVAQSGYSKIKNFLFLSLTYPTVVNDQKNRFDLSYNYSQEPVVVDGKRVYDFFIRVVKTEDGKGATLQNATQVVTFDGRNEFSRLLNIEKASNAESLNLRLNYVKEFDKDTTRITSWGTEIIKFAIPKES